MPLCHADLGVMNLAEAAFFVFLLVRCGDATVGGAAENPAGHGSPAATAAAYDPDGAAPTAKELYRRMLQRQEDRTLGCN